MTRQVPRQRGFTLIEVLVALLIVAVAMSAAVRASGQMSQSNALLRERSVALLAAQNSLAELRLRGVKNKDSAMQRCDQGRLKLSCEQRVTRSGDLLRVQVLVHDREQHGPPLARLETLFSRPIAKP
ncbi:type II secretion system minor pseudopilin GspI [Pseudomonas sp. SWRI92]|uniref:Type II secretion system protein I n=1 Tax=Pseudomonas marvdashtae TaxID=2745500 RepID=A0A923JPD3_9PSED|nr:MULTISPECIES: type II secretion system minor pseudopilin GspI [Pseudomonas]MBC3362246.1 type II secretion system minor pseudopilin GspI [Pseudomonas sp. SWRI154]MBC3375847.1 type II secretion system minor pseudopilin GspI [Pseudomonas sp. SWRI92]MBV4552227.1 type II secretion system minor pseudopilin GspI [Pseudomonas marvdashtae]